MTRYHRRSWMMTALVAALLAVSGLAAATPGTTDDTDTDMTEDSASVIEYEFFEDQNLLVYWMAQPEPSDEEPVDCTEGLGDATGEDGAALELPEGCYGVDVAGPNDQINHGTIMSAFVHSLKDVEFDGPRGHAVRELAKSDLGKGDQELEADDDSDTDSDEPKVKEDKTNGPPEHANSNAHKEKPNKP